MIVERDHFRHCYETLRKDSFQTPIAIYVSTSDVDALCACRILKSMLQSDKVPFSVFPVAGKRSCGSADRIFRMTNKNARLC